MNVGNLPDPVLITRPGPLKILAEALEREQIIAVDTESNSLFAYQEQVCLIQFSVSQGDYLVDPLAVKDLSPLGQVFGDPGVEKVFHAAEYDLICMKRDFGFQFSNLFDTMIAARVLGREAIGLGALLEEEFGVKLNKRFQRADWGQRPLPPQLLAYARFDTHYLIQLRQRLRDELEARDLLPLAMEDFQRIVEVNGNGRSPGDERQDCWRVSGSYDLTPQQAAVLDELCQYRDRVARRANRPLFKVFGDDTLRAIASATPSTLDELAALPGMTEGQVLRHGVRLLEAVERGLKSVPIHPPRSPRPDERFLERLELLRRWRKTTAAQLGVASDVVLPRDLLYNLAEMNPTRPEELAQAMRSAPWRLQRFGEQILGLLAGA